MRLKQKIPLFELDVRDLTTGRLQLVLPEMESDDWLLVHQEGRGYCALNCKEARNLASEVKEGTIFTLEKADPVVYEDLSSGEIESQLDERSPERRRMLFVGDNAIRVVFETTMAAGGAMDIGIFRPEGVPPVVSGCPILSPKDRPPGQPWLERDHEFSASSVGTYWICGLCGDRCVHPPEQRLPMAASNTSCGRCGATGLNP